MEVRAVGIVPYEGSDTLLDQRTGDTVVVPGVDLQSVADDADRRVSGRAERVDGTAPGSERGVAIQRQRSPGGEIDVAAD